MDYGERMRERVWESEIEKSRNREIGIEREGEGS